MEATKPFNVATVDQINDHAKRIDVLTQIGKNLGNMVDRNTATEAQNAQDLTHNAELVVDNDKQLKQGLKELEAMVTAQGAAIPELRTDVQQVVRDIAGVMQSQAGQGGVSSQGPAAAEETRTAQTLC